MIRFALLFLIFLSGCVSTQEYKNTMAGQFTRLPVQTVVDANVGLEVRHTLSPAMRGVWKAWLNPDSFITNYEQAVTEMVRDDVVRARLFSGTHIGGATTSDLLVRIETTEDKDDAQYWVTVSLIVLHPKTGAVLSQYRRQQVTSTSMLSHRPLKTIPTLVLQTARDLRADVPRLVAIVRQGDLNEVAKACDQWDDVPRRIRSCTELITRTEDRPSLQATAYAERAAGYMQTRDLDRAAADLEQALRRDPNHIRAHYFRARIAQTRRQYEQAARDYDRTAALMDAKPDAGTRDGGADMRARAREMEARLGMEQHWIEYLKEVQSSGDYDNWSGPPYDLYRGSRR